MNKSKVFKFLNHIIQISIQDIPPLYTHGITNETEDYHFIPFIDLDNIYLHKVKKLCNFLAREFKLSACIILCSSDLQQDENGRYFGNFSVVFFDKLNYFTICKLLSFCPIDYESVLVPRFYKYKSWVLRISEKYNSEGNIIVERPELIEVIDYGNRIHECSYAHYKFYRLRFHLPKLDLNFDNSTKIYLIDYNTRGNKQKKELVKI